MEQNLLLLRYFCQPGSSPDDRLDYTNFKVTIRTTKAASDGRMHPSCPSLWQPALNGREEESRLKIASFGSVICWKSAYGGYMWLSKLAGAGRRGTDKDRIGARGGLQIDVERRGDEERPKRKSSY